MRRLNKLMIFNELRRFDELRRLKDLLIKYLKLYFYIE